ncbi:hypothetical protein ACFX1X_012505 [Malus domestica]
MRLAHCVDCLRAGIIMAIPLVIAIVYKSSTECTSHPQSASDRSGKCVEKQTVSSMFQMSLPSQVEDDNTSLELRLRGWRGREDITLRRCASGIPWWTQRG